MSNAIQAKVPTDRSMLSILGANTIQNGDDFRMDGYVYNKGKRVRRWHTRIDDGGDGFKIWEPKLENIAHLEALRWEARQRAVKIIDPIWKDLVDRMKKAKKFYAYIEFKGGGKGWARYEIDDRGISWNWAEDMKPSDRKPVCQKLGDAYRAYEDKSELIWRNVRVVRNAFVRAIQNEYYKRMRNDRRLLTPRLQHYVINGREYWFELLQERFRQELVPLAMPEDTENVDIKII